MGLSINKKRWKRISDCAADGWSDEKLVRWRPGWLDHRERKHRGRFAQLAFVMTICALLLVACGGGTSLVGTILPKEKAADFTLLDQRGESVSLSDFKGKAVVLTFIFTNCPDTCPITAEALRATDNLLPEKNRDKTVMLAVTVDPERDSAEALQRFSEAHQLADNPRWYTLRGDRPTLEKVWQSYGVDARTMLLHDLPGAHEEGVIATPDDPNAEVLIHTDAVYVIDRDGNKRVLMRSSLQPQDLANNLKALTK